MFKPGEKRVLEIHDDAQYQATMQSVDILTNAIRRLTRELRELRDERQRISLEKALSNHNEDLEMYLDALKVWRGTPKTTINQVIQFGHMAPTFQLSDLKQ